MMVRIGCKLAARGQWSPFDAYMFSELYELQLDYIGLVCDPPVIRELHLNGRCIWLHHDITDTTKWHDMMDATDGQNMVDIKLKRSTT